MAWTGKVQLQIGKGVYCRNLPIGAVRKIEKDLVFDNPVYINAERHGGYVGVDVMRYLYYYEVSDDKKTIWIPRGYLWFLQRWLKQNKYPVNIIDKTLLLPTLDIEFHGELREYQEEAVYAMVNRYPCGVLEAATGSGKTVMACGIIARRKQPTVIIVHSKELLYQWQEAIKNFLHYDCGLVGDGKNDIKPITVSIINTVKNRMDSLPPEFGQVICDEVHRAPSTTWTECVTEFPARHYVGLTATAFRQDGLGNVMFAHIGPKIHVVDKEVLHATGAVLKPKIIPVYTDFRAARCFADEEKLAYSTVIKKLTEDTARNELIVDKIQQDLRHFKQNVLCVSDRVAHCSEIAQILRSRNIECHVLSGGTGKNDRVRIIADVKAGRVKVLISTASLISEGFDSPNLAALFMGTPIKFSGRIIQIVGRILRPEKGKIPRVYDFRDDNVRVLRYSGFHRMKVYAKQWGKAA